MNELKNIKDITTPDEILLTVDAMTGQDAVNVAQSFHEQLEVTGAVISISSSFIIRSARYFV